MEKEIAKLQKQFPNASLETLENIIATHNHEFVVIYSYDYNMEYYDHIEKKDMSFRNISDFEYITFDSEFELKSWICKNHNDFSINEVYHFGKLIKFEIVVNLIE
jgi:hypothetical protein